MRATPLVIIAVGLSLLLSAPTIGTSGPRGSISWARGRWRRGGHYARLPGPAPGYCRPAASRRHGRRGAVGPDSGPAQDAFQGQRDPDQPDAGLCRRADPRLSRARPLAGPGRAQLPAHRQFRSELRCRPCSTAARSISARLSRSGRRRRRHRALATPQGLRDPASSDRRRAAARFAGFSADRMTLFVFAVSGALAGLAGISEVAGQIGQLQIPFAAVWLHGDHRRLSRAAQSVGILLAGLVLALSYLGGEAAQIALKVPIGITSVIQGMLLFYVLACDTLILYRVRIISASAKVACDTR